MSLKEEVKNNLKVFLMKGKELEVSTLRQLMSSVLNKEKEKRFSILKQNPSLSQEEIDEKSQLSEDEVLDIVGLEVKKRREAIEGFEKGGRIESAEKERKELEILSKYLPEQLSKEEIENLVKEALENTKAETIKDIGKVMAYLTPKTKGRADSALIGRMVKEKLQ